MSSEFFDEDEVRGEAPEIPDDLDENSESYRLVYETIKKRPVNIRKKLQNILWTAAAAVIFGLIAALLIAKLVPVFTEKEPENIHLTPDGEAEVTVTPEPTPVPTPTPVPEPEPEPEPDPGTTVYEPKPETSADRIESNRNFLNDIKTIGMNSRRSVVSVAGITTVEDWFNNVDEDRAITSGILVADNGMSFMILTDAETVEDANSIAVTFYDGSVSSATFVKKDPVTGLAIISVNKANMQDQTIGGVNAATLNLSEEDVTGDPVIALGYPLGFADSVIYGQIISDSSKLSLTDREYDILVTNIQGSPEGSGALIDLEGKFAGIIWQKYSPVEGGNIIVAIPVSELKGLIERLSNNEGIPYLGITGETVTNDISVASGVPLGVYITDVEIDSPAFNAGLQRGDIIVSVNETEVTGMTDIESLLDESEEGSTLKIAVKRSNVNDYTDMEFEVELGSI